MDLEERKTGMGGSDIAAILGLSQFKTPFEIYQSKVGEVEEKQNELFYWGNALEDPIAKRFEEETGYQVILHPETKRHPSHHFAIANADGLIQKNGETIGILEIKTSSAFKSKEWSLDDAEEIPIEYFAQVQWYLEIFDLDMAYLAVLIGGNQYRHYPIKRDRELGESLIAKGKEFWENHVLKQIPPEKTEKELLEQFPRDNGKTVEATTEILIEFNHLIALKEARKQLDEKIEKLENFLKIQIGENQQMNAGEIKLFTFQSQKTKRFDSNKFKEDHPDLYKMYLKETENRVLRLFKKG